MPPITMPDETAATLFAKIDKLASTVSDLRVEVAELRTELKLRPACPSPGECDNLGRRLDDFEETVASHRIVLAQVQGGWKTLAILCSAAVAASSLVTWAVGHFWK